MRALIALSLLVIVGACDVSQNRSHDAEAHAANALAIEDAWAAATPASVDVSAGYLTFANTTTADDRLLRATSPRAGRVEVHEMTMDGSVMRMRPIEMLTIPAGEQVILAPGAAHLMFYGVTQPFAEGEEIPVRFTFETAGEIDVVLPVRRSAPARHASH